MERVTTNEAQNYFGRCRSMMSPESYFWVSRSPCCVSCDTMDPLPNTILSLPGCVFIAPIYANPIDKERENSSTLSLSSQSERWWDASGASRRQPSSEDQ